MELTDAKAFLELVTAEYRRRSAKLDDLESEDKYDHWVCIDLPFLHDLCVLYLVAVRHHVERRLLFFAACAAEQGEKMTRADFYKRRSELLKLSNKLRWNKIEQLLNPNQCTQYRSLEALRLLANSYKHDPALQPSAKLIEYLGLNKTLSYAPIPESSELQKGLARLVGLGDDAHFPDITQKFVEHAEEFLKDVQTRNVISKVDWGRVSLTDYAH